MSSRRQIRTAARLLHETGHASASVIAGRMLAFADLQSALSPWHQSEARRMTTEKFDAARDGMLSAGAEMALMPWRMLHLATRPAAWTTSGLVEAWMEGAGLWIGVGNAALRPARATAVRNRTRLARSRG